MSVPSGPQSPGSSRGQVCARPDVTTRPLVLEQRAHLTVMQVRIRRKQILHIHQYEGYETSGSSAVTALQHARLS